MTSRLFSAGWLVSAALLSSWAVSSASDEPRTLPRRALPPGPEPLPALSLELDAEIARLSSRTQHVVPAASAVRDPFSFGRRAKPRRRVARATAVSEFSSPSVSSASRAAAVSKSLSPSVMREGEESLRKADALPDAASLLTQLRLTGVAEMTAGNFTAVISFSSELHYLRKGDVIAGRYRIDAIALDGVDVFDIVLGTISRLKLQSPNYNSH